MAEIFSVCQAFSVVELSRLVVVKDLDDIADLLVVEMKLSCFSLYMIGISFLLIPYCITFIFPYYLYSITVGFSASMIPADKFVKTYTQKRDSVLS